MIPCIWSGLEVITLPLESIIFVVIIPSPVVT